MTWTIRKIELYLTQVRNDLAIGAIEASAFDMSTTLDIGDCGTVGCIAGWCLWKDAQARLGRDPKDWHEIHSDLDAIVADVRKEDKARGDGLYNLFFWWVPEEPSIAEAVVAIDKWLAGDDQPWPQRAIER